MHPHTIAVQVMNIDFVAQMIASGHITHAKIKRVLSHQLVSGFSLATAEAMLIHIGVLILHM